jgi:Zn-finger nucleic acid-binding protein
MRSAFAPERCCAKNPKRSFEEYESPRATSVPRYRDLAKLGSRRRNMLCPHCGNPASPLARLCAHCGKVAQPATARSPAVIQCPRCNSDAEFVSLGSIDIDSCASCGNLWFDNLELERVSHAADGAAGTDLRDALRALGPRRAVGLGPSVVRCPFCPEELVRRTHPEVPDVVAHVCTAHGAWLERSFLLRLLDDLETASLATLRARDARLVAERAALQRATDRQVEELQRFRQRHLWFWFF